MVKILSGKQKNYECELCGSLFHTFGPAEIHQRWECEVGHEVRTAFSKAVMMEREGAPPLPVEDKEAEEDAGGPVWGDMFLGAIVLAIGTAILDAIYDSFNLGPFDEVLDIPQFQRVGVIISAIVIIYIVRYHSPYFRKNDE